MDAQKILLQPCDFTPPLVPIGRGKDSVIYAAYCAKLGGQVAIKVYQKSRISASKLRAIKREAAIMTYLLKKSVPSITTYYGAFQTQNEICIVMEYCPRGDLLELLLAEGRAFAEPRVAEVAATLLTTLERMHALSVIHRDVKLENIFIGAGGELKLGDFGLTMSMKQEAAISPVGTVEHMAPEVVALPRVELVASGAIDPASIAACDTGVDVWALGITVYELLSGHLPFDGRDKVHIKRAIATGDMRPLPESVSEDARDFVAAMLERDRAARPTAGALLCHPFLARSACGSPRSVLPPVAVATAYIHAETSPWPTKGGTACSEVQAQHSKCPGASKLSIPESPDQLRGGPQRQLVSPVAFWNSDMATPEAAPDGQLIRACHGGDELLTPLFPATSPPAAPPGGTPALFGSLGGGFGCGDAAAAGGSNGTKHAGSGGDTGSSPAAGGPAPSFSFQSLGQPDGSPARMGAGAGSPSGRSSPAPHSSPLANDVAVPWRTSPPPSRSPSRLSHCSSSAFIAAPFPPPQPLLASAGSHGNLLAPYSPAAAGGDPVGEEPCDDESALSWRHGQAHQDGLPWSPGRILQKIGFFFRPAASVR